jgi:hypothetical protein
MSKAHPATPNTDKRLFYASLVLFIVTAAFTVTILARRNLINESATPSSAANNTSALQVPMTASSIEPTQLAQLKQSVAACADYSAERRRQMEQHLAWLADTTQIPVDLLPAFGNNPPEKLIFGMATYTSIEWKLAKRPPASCLIPIGQTLNELLIQMGSEPFSEFSS